eukprot:TRINITY_DN1774_c0_g3_i1.p1 TRINITY_DN1774_c0_g3~~TRINITY_DN1774_c0_g3_i1.p1  ORF type:complete len:214 (+),score=49.39 TRINITY_DN1774_c0_g3_i1:640-1281(+)
MLPDGTHRRDPFHPFRSAPPALRSVLQLFDMEVDQKKMNDWDKTVNSSFILRDDGIPIHDNSRLPLILADLSDLLKTAKPTSSTKSSSTSSSFQQKVDRVEVIVLLVLLHQSFHALDEWPNAAILDDNLFEELFFSRMADSKNASELKESSTKEEGGEWRFERSKSQRFLRLIRILAMADSLSYDMFDPSLSYFYQGEINLNFGAPLDRFEKE